MLAYYIYRIEGVGYLVRSENVKGVVLVCDNTGPYGLRGCRHLAAQACEHGGEDDDIALAAGIDDSGLLQDRVLIDGVLKRFVSDPERGLEKLFYIRALFRIFCGGCRGHAGNGQYRALRGLHNRLVGRIDTVLHGGGEFLCADGLHALESARYAAEQKRQDNARVSARAAQQSARHAVGNGIDRVKFFLSELGRRLVHGQAHICARITVGHGENVKLVYLLSVLSKRGVSAEDHVLEHRGV